MVSVKRLLDPPALPEADEPLDMGCEAEAPLCEAPAGTTAGVAPPDADEPLAAPDAELPLTADEAADEADDATDDAEDTTAEAEDTALDPLAELADADEDPLADAELAPEADAPVANGSGTTPAPADAEDAELALPDADEALEPDADMDVALAEDAEPLIDDAEPLAIELPDAPLTEPDAALAAKGYTPEVGNENELLAADAAETALSALCRSHAAHQQRRARSRPGCRRWPLHWSAQSVSMTAARPHVEARRHDVGKRLRGALLGQTILQGVGEVTLAAVCKSQPRAHGFRTHSLQRP